MIFHEGSTRMLYCAAAWTAATLAMPDVADQIARKGNLARDQRLTIVVFGLEMRSSYNFASGLNDLARDNMEEAHRVRSLKISGSKEKEG